MPRSSGNAPSRSTGIGNVNSPRRSDRTQGGTQSRLNSFRRTSPTAWNNLPPSFGSSGVPSAAATATTSDNVNTSSGYTIPAGRSATGTTANDISDPQPNRASSLYASAFGSGPQGPGQLNPVSQRSTGVGGPGIASSLTDPSRYTHVLSTDEGAGSIYKTESDNAPLSGVHDQSRYQANSGIPPLQLSVGFHTVDQKRGEWIDTACLEGWIGSPEPEFHGGRPYYSTTLSEGMSKTWPQSTPEWQESVAVPAIEESLASFHESVVEPKRQALLHDQDTMENLILHEDAREGLDPVIEAYIQHDIQEGANPPEGE